MLLYLYTFPGHQTHSDPTYFRRGKLGETDRAGKLTEHSSEEEIYARVIQRIKQQDNAAVSEAPVVLGYWFVKTNTGSGVDDHIRELLITNHGAKVARADKNKTEWVIIPGNAESDRIALVEQTIREFADGQLIERQLNEINLRDVQNEIVASFSGTGKSIHIAGCAAGKTFAELYVLETEVPNDTQVNVLCTSGIELANQICGELMYNTTTKQAWGSRKIILVHSGRCQLPGIEATVDVEEIARQCNNATVPVWVVVVYNSVRTAARGVALADRSVHAKVLDEVHRTTGTAATIFTDAVLLKSNIQRSFTASFRAIVR